MFRPESWVLVTADDRMPADHGELIAELGVTIATIDRRRESICNHDEWRRDVVQRWVHAMQDQPPNSVRRYGISGHRTWTARGRR